jgi:hypothetical protein
MSTAFILIAVSAACLRNCNHRYLFDRAPARLR